MLNDKLKHIGHKLKHIGDKLKLIGRAKVKWQWTLK